MRIVFGADHRGMAQHDALIAALGQLGEILDVSQTDPALTDYVEVSEKVAAYLKTDGGFGVIICGTGIGISVVANKHAGLSAARCVSVEDAVDCRLVNNSNILCLSAKTPVAVNEEIVHTFLATPFPADERRTRRLQKIAELEQRNFK